MCATCLCVCLCLRRCVRRVCVRACVCVYVCDVLRLGQAGVNSQVDDALAWRLLVAVVDVVLSCGEVTGCYLRSFRNSTAECVRYLQQLVSLNRQSILPPSTNSAHCKTAATISLTWLLEQTAKQADCSERCSAPDDQLILLRIQVSKVIGSRTWFRWFGRGLVVW